LKQAAPGEAEHYLLPDLSRCLIRAAAKLNLPGDAAVIKESWLDPERFSVLFDSHFAEIHRYVARRLGRDAADVLAAGVFLAAFRQRHRYDLTQTSARPWLYGIATRLIGRHRWQEMACLRALAGRSRSSTMAGEVAPEGQRAGTGAVSAEIARALATLRPSERDAVMMAALADLNHDEIAVALGVKPPVAASRLHHGSARLRAAPAGRAFLNTGHWPGMDELQAVRAVLPAPAVGPAPWVIADAWASLRTPRRRPRRLWRASPR
jgi:RNA polymerase sigma-70 factor (ECF subfamily)